jgi:DnaB-like helicase N terminal domain/Protein of unknown function (DUF3987)
MSTNGNGYHEGNGHAAVMSDHLPPQNLEAERAVLASCLLDPKCIPDVIDILKADDFYRAVHQILYRAILILHAQGVGIDVITLTEELTRQGSYGDIGGDEFMLSIANSIPHAANVLYHAQIVKQKATSRRAIQISTEIIRDGYSTMFSANQLVDRGLKQLLTLESETEEEPDAIGFADWPEPLADEAFHGIAGDLVRIIDPHTEADPAAILFQFLAGMGNMLGRRAHWRVEATRHHLNLFVCLAGISSKARKGTSFDHIVWLLEKVDPLFTSTRLGHGYTSGEGLISDVADDMVTNGTITPGVSDKRLFWVEGEFGGVLTIMSRDGNTLSSVTRSLWDGKTVAGRSKNRPLRATGAHVSIVGHITVVEVNALLGSTNAANGFGNRFLWTCAKRSKLLPHGGALLTSNLDGIARDLEEVQSWVNQILDPDVPLMRSRESNAIWESVYPELSSGRPGLLGAMISRAEAQVMRLAAIYAVLEKDAYIRPPHLKAALACWRYCEQSARFIFGERLGDASGEKVVKALTDAGMDGLGRAQINRLAFGGHKSPEDLEAILGRLIQAGVTEQFNVTTGDKRKRGLKWRLKDREIVKDVRALRADFPSHDHKPF